MAWIETIVLMCVVTSVFGQSSSGIMAGAITSQAAMNSSNVQPSASATKPIQATSSGVMTISVSTDVVSSSGGYIGPSQSQQTSNLSTTAIPTTSPKTNTTKGDASFLVPSILNLIVLVFHLV